VRRLEFLGVFDSTGHSPGGIASRRVSRLCKQKKPMTETENNQPYRRLSRRGTLAADMTLAATLVLATVASAKPAIGGDEAQ
jgi:hypothetical protein